MNVKQRTIAVLVLLVSLAISGCQPGQTPGTTLPPTPFPPTPTRMPEQTPAPTLTPLPVATNPPQATRPVALAGCPGSPYSLHDTGYAVPADLSSGLKAQILELSSTDPLTRITAARSIKGYGEEAVQALPFLVILSQDQARLKWQSGFSTTPGAEAITAIADVKGACAVLALQTILDNGDQATRPQAAQTLGNSLDPGALDILYALLHDADFGVRYNALYSLGVLISNQVYDQASLENLIEVATKAHEDDGIRLLAASDIGLIATNDETAKDQAIDALVQLTGDPLPSIRSGVAQTLRDFDEPKVIEALISLLQDQNSLVTFYAADSLKKLTGQDFGKDYEKWNEWWMAQHDSLFN